MTFTKSNRKLVSSTGYLKSTDGSVYESPIYLGIYDSDSNYSEVGKEEYETYLKKQEEEQLEPPHEESEKEHNGMIETQ